MDAEKVKKTIVVTGGAGFIGSNFVNEWFSCYPDAQVIVLDALTYAGHLENLAAAQKYAGFKFVQGNIADASCVQAIFAEYQPEALINFAAESHVDRSIHGPGEFIQTNVNGTFNLLECARHYWAQLDAAAQAEFRFLHVSTDEVYGSLEADDAPFTEQHPYQPNSPYSASKAASDHLVRAWFHTYGLPVLTTNCSNNYGPFHYPEKLIPLVIQNALAGKTLPIYGDGSNVRDWLFVTDHCAAIRRVLVSGRLGETYNIGGWNEKTNLDVVKTICAQLDALAPRQDGVSYAEQICFVKDRPGHDKRYAIDASKLASELAWKPQETFESGIAKTVAWYLDHQDWVRAVTGGAFDAWVRQQYQ